jgi:hypothetical protein
MQNKERNKGIALFCYYTNPFTFYTKKALREIWYKERVGLYNFLCSQGIFVLP